MEPLEKLPTLPTVTVAALPVPPPPRLAAAARLGERRPGAGHAPDTPAYSRRTARVQVALMRMGLYHGPVDGDLDGETLMAVRTFQHRLGDP